MSRSEDEWEREMAEIAESRRRRVRRLYRGGMSRERLATYYGTTLVEIDVLLKRRCVPRAS